MKATMDRATHDELVGVIEDAVEYFCDNEMVSGELAWIIVETLATAKIQQLKGNIN